VKKGSAAEGKKRKKPLRGKKPLPAFASEGEESRKGSEEEKKGRTGSNHSRRPEGRRGGGSNGRKERRPHILLRVTGEKLRRSRKSFLRFSG